MLGPIPTMCWSRPYRAGYKHRINDVDILKIDVEGVDHLVLKGFGQRLGSEKIRVIQFEDERL